MESVDRRPTAAGTSEDELIFKHLLLLNRPSRLAWRRLQEGKDKLLQRPANDVELNKQQTVGPVSHQGSQVVDRDVRIVVVYRDDERRVVGSSDSFNGFGATREKGVRDAWSSNPVVFALPLFDIRSAWFGR